MPAKKPLTKDEIRARRYELHRRACDGELALPEAVREMRNAIGFTQEKFAKAFGLTRKQVIELESGKGNPTLETLMKVGRPFGFQVGFVRDEEFPDWLRKDGDPKASKKPTEERETPCVFRGDPPTDSDLMRPPVPILSAHRFRGIRPPL